MKTPTKYIVLTIVVVFALLFFAIQNNNLIGQMNNSTAINQSLTVDGNGKMTEPESSKYIPYSSEVLAENNTKRRVLFFYANWCPTCRPVDQEIQNNMDRIPKDVIIIRVNYEDSDTNTEEKELAKKYEITYQHTFVEIDSNGRVLQKWNGGSLADILSKLN